MGACNCIDRREGENQIVTSKAVMGFRFEKSFEEFAETKEDLTARGARRAMMPNEKEYDLEGVRQLIGDEVTPQAQQTEGNNRKNQNGRVETVVENKAHLKDESFIESASGNDIGERQDTLLMVGRGSESEETDFTDLNNEIFKLFNDIRLNPEKYEHSVDSRLRSTLRKIIDERVDATLWSNKGYEIAFDYLNSIEERNIPTAQISNYLTQAFNSSSREEEQVQMLILSHFGQHDSSTLFTLLAENLAEGKRALSDSFTYGFVCSFSVSNKEERTILCLAKKQ